jgi:hypothetical protein
MMAGLADRPLVFLDVDGPLIPFRARPVRRGRSPGDASGNPLVSRLDPDDGRRLLALGCHLVWATTWMAEANEVISPRLGLPRLPVVDFPDTDDEPARGLHWKTVYLTRWAAGRPFIWTDGRHVPELAAEMIRAACGHTSAGGARHTPFPAAERALTEFAGLYVDQGGPGVALRRPPFALDPAMAAPTATTLADFGQALGVRLFPLGVEGKGDALLAIDERGRVFALDPGGEWHLGDDLDAALTTLVTGTVPPRVRDDGTW